MQESLDEGNRKLYRSYEAAVAWSIVETVGDISLEDYTEQTFQTLQLGKNDILCAIEISSQSWYTVCGTDIVIDDALEDCVSAGIDNILNKRNAEAIHDFYSDLSAWFSSYDTSSNESLNEPTEDMPVVEEAAEQTQTPALPDGEYVLTVYSKRLYPADEGVYADVDMSLHITLDKDVLWCAKVGDIVDLTQFNGGTATVRSVYPDGDGAEVTDVYIESNGDSGEANVASFHYSESDGCWIGEDAAGGYATYYIESVRVLFPPTTGITDYDSYYNGGKCEEGTVHSDIRDYFALYDYPDMRVRINVTLQNGVVTEAEVPYHP